MTWAILGESVIGTSHRGRSLPCQDAFRFRTFGASDEWLVVAVADGAGSATHSQIGATLACDELIRLVESLELSSLFTREGMTILFGVVRNALVTEAERLDVRPREIACTALLAVVGPTTAAFAQLGDGAIITSAGQDHRTVFWPEPGEYANTTDFLTDDRFADTIQFETSTDSINELAVITDGLQRLSLDFTARAPYPAFFRPLFDRLRMEPDPELLFEELRHFLDSPRVNNRTDDDKTLVLAVRRP